MKRKVADELAQRKNLEIAALWGNTNLDGDDPNARQDAMNAIEDNFDKAIAGLYGYKNPEDEEVDQNDPFWQAMERGLQKRKLPEPQPE